MFFHVWPGSALNIQPANSKRLSQSDVARLTSPTLIIACSPLQQSHRFPEQAPCAHWLLFGMAVWRCHTHNLAQSRRKTNPAPFNAILIKGIITPADKKRWRFNLRPRQTVMSQSNLGVWAPRLVRASRSRWL